MGNISVQTALKIQLEMYLPVKESAYIIITFFMHNLI